MAEITFDTAAETLRDILYVSIGAGVIAFQKLQVQRQEINKAMLGQIDEARNTAKGNFDSVSELAMKRVKDLEERMEGMETDLENLLSQVEDRLPAQARDFMKQARTIGRRAA